MENVAYVQEISIIQYINTPNLLNEMINIGFDFALTGTKYIYELFIEPLENINNLNELFLPNMSSLADRHNIKLKSLNRDVRWSIEKNTIDDTDVCFDLSIVHN